MGPKARLDITKQRSFLALMGIERRLLGRAAHSLVALPSELSWRIFKHKHAREAESNCLRDRPSAVGVKSEDK